MTPKAVKPEAADSEADRGPAATSPDPQGTEPGGGAAPPSPATNPRGARETLADAIREAAEAVKREVQGDETRGPAAASRRLIEILREAGALPGVDLDAVRAEYPDEYLGHVLVRERLAKETEIHAALIRTLRIPWLAADLIQVSENVRQLLPESFCHEHHVLPVCRARDFLTLAMANPLDREAIEEVERRTGLRVRPVLCSEQPLDLSILSAFSTPSDEEPEDERSEEEDMTAVLTEATEAFSAADGAQPAPADPAASARETPIAASD